MQLIGLSGAARSGKDTVGEYLAERHFYKRYAFADPLKRAASEVFGLPLHTFYEGDREIKNKFWGFSPREMLQLLGTEGVRKVFRDDTWIKRAEMEWNTHRRTVDNDVADGCEDIDGVAGMVITDVRFENEAQFIKDMGGIVIHIERPGFVGDVGVGKHHASEAGYSDSLKDVVIANEGTLDELYVKVDMLVNYCFDTNLLRGMPAD